jgi:acyl dehydratase
MPPEEGATFTHERTFTEESVREFADATGDTQPRHTEPDEDGRLVVHGLLTGSLLTKIGGDLEMLARTMTFEFRKPVYTGDTIRCEWTHESVDPREDGRYDVEASVTFRRIDAPGGSGEEGELVLSARVSGLLS